jgi:hypothetical protein
MGSKIFHIKPAAFKAMQNRITMYFRGIILPPGFLYTREPVLEDVFGHLVAVATAGLVALLGPYQDGRRRDGGRSSVDETLRARGFPAAAGADGP